MQEVSKAHINLKERTAELFKEHLRNIRQVTNSIFFGLLLLQWSAAIILSFITAPASWEGANGTIHPNIWLTFVLGGALFVIPAIQIHLAPTRSWTGGIVAIAQMAFSMLFIHLSDNRVETHFHIFGSLALLAFYRDTRIILLATSLVIADHFMKHSLLQNFMHASTSGDHWRTIELAWWLGFEAVFLCIATVRSHAEMRRMASSQANLEATNKVIEERIAERTRELQAARDTAIQASKSKSEFLSNVSHEIRTPMNAIIGMTELALKTHLTMEQRDYLSTSHEASIALLSLLNEILDFSKIEAGKLMIANEDFNLRDLLHNTIKPLAFKAAEANLELICSVAQDVPTNLVGDSLRTRQILTNLIGNALKFTHRGEVAIVINVVSQTPKSAKLRFEVKDTGIGIEADQLKNIFEAFQQADSTTTRRYGGTGLGLSISNSLLRLMGGSALHVESESGQGSTFSFELDFPLGQITLQQRPAELQKLNDRSVVVVAENSRNRDNLAAILRNWGIEVVTFASSTAAQEYFQITKGSPIEPAVLITDYKMPELSGMNLAALLRQDAQWQDLKVIIGTSVDNIAQVSSAVGRQIDAYLIKPIMEHELGSALATVLTRKAAPIQKLPAMDSAAGPPAMRILVAEDNLVNQKLILRILEKAGHTVTIAENGEDCLSILSEIGYFSDNLNVDARDSYDLILMDLHMPVMGGVEATAVIRERECENNLKTRIPIIALTAHTAAEFRDEYQNKGLDGYLSKPINTEILFKTLAEVAYGLVLSKPKQPSDNNQRSSAPDQILKSVDGDLGLLFEILGAVYDNANTLEPEE